jgi:hypothetical protein
LGYVGRRRQTDAQDLPDHLVRESWRKWRIFQKLVRARQLSG